MEVAIIITGLVAFAQNEIHVMATSPELLTDIDIGSRHKLVSEPLETAAHGAGFDEIEVTSLHLSRIAREVGQEKLPEPGPQIIRAVLAISVHATYRSVPLRHVPVVFHDCLSFYPREQILENLEELGAQTAVTGRTQSQGTAPKNPRALSFT